MRAWLVAGLGLSGAIGCTSVGGMKTVTPPADRVPAVVAWQDEGFDDGGFAAVDEGPVGPGLGGPERPPPRVMIGVDGFFGTDGFAVGTAGNLSAEFPVAKQFGIAGRLGGYSYIYDDGDALAPGNNHEEEEGNGFGAGFEWKWYTSKQAFKGFFLGVGAAYYFAGDWENREDVNGDGIFQPTEIEEGTGAAAEVHGTFGVAINIKQRVVITPALIFGTYAGTDVSAPFWGLGLRFQVGF